MTGLEWMGVITVFTSGALYTGGYTVVQTRHFQRETLGSHRLRMMDQAIQHWAITAAYTVRGGGRTKQFTRCPLYDKPGNMYVRERWEKEPHVSLQHSSHVSKIEINWPSFSYINGLLSSPVCNSCQWRPVACTILMWMLRALRWRPVKTVDLH